MSGYLEFPSKPVDATRPLVFDFTSAVPTGVTIASATATVSVWSGTDSNPSAMLSGSPSVSGLQVTQVVTAGVNGVVYVIEVDATGSDGNIYPRSGFLAVTTDTF